MAGQDSSDPVRNRTVSGRAARLLTVVVRDALGSVVIHGRHARRQMTRETTGPISLRLGPCLVRVGLSGHRNYRRGLCFAGSIQSWPPMKDSLPRALASSLLWKASSVDNQACLPARRRRWLCTAARARAMTRTRGLSGGGCRAQPGPGHRGALAGNGRGGRHAADALLTALMPLASWSVAAEHGVRADSRHSGTAGTRVKGVDATFMLLERYGSGIHVVSVRRRRSDGHVSPVTAVPKERRNTSSQGRDVRYPAQDQLQLDGTAARLRPDAIPTRPQRSRRHGQRIGLSPHVVRTPRIGHGEHQAGRESWRLAARP